MSFIIWKVFSDLILPYNQNAIIKRNWRKFKVIIIIVRWRTIIQRIYRFYYINNIKSDRNELEKY